MDTPLWMKVMSAVVLVYFIIRILPNAKHQLKHGPKGTSRQWLDVSMLLGGVVLFVAFLVLLVRSS